MNQSQVDIIASDLEALCHSKTIRKPEFRSAIQRQLSHRKKLLTEINRHDMKALHSEHKSISTNKDGDAGNRDDSNAIRRREIEEIDWNVSHFIPELNNIEYNLIASHCLVNEFSRAEILEFADTEWNDRHEILSRWAWMKFHNGLANFEKVDFPYLCDVGPPTTRNTPDREYFKMKLFLEHYNETTGNKFLFLSKPKQDPPDFLIESESGEINGLEVTEVPVSESFYEQQKHGERFKRYLKDRFKNNKALITIWHFQSWDELYILREEIGNWLSDLLSNPESFDSTDTKSEERKFHHHKDINFTININSWPHFIVQEFSGDESGFRNENRYEPEIKKRLADKFDSNLQENYPCILAMYLNGTFNADMEELKKRVLKMDLKFDSNPFEETWLIKEKDSIRLM